MVKDRMFKPEQYDAETIAATHWTLFQVGLRLLQMFAPYLPFITEVLYEQLFKNSVGQNSLHQTKFTTIQTTHSYPNSVLVVNKLTALISIVRRLKTDKQLSLKVPLASLSIIASDEKTVQTIQQHEQLIKGITQAETMLYYTDKHRVSELVHTDEKWLATVSLDEPTDGTLA